jgi:glutathione S-transferase
MKANEFKLYQLSGSPNSRRVRVFLAEKGICMPMVPVDLGAKEQFSEAYADINPRRVVPTLMLADGTAIGEVPTILRYLEDVYPEPPLYGTQPSLSGVDFDANPIRQHCGGLRVQAVK